MTDDQTPTEQTPPRVEERGLITDALGNIITGGEPAVGAALVGKLGQTIKGDNADQAPQQTPEQTPPETPDK